MDKTVLEKALADMQEKLPVKHVAGPDEVAEAYLFLMKFVLASLSLSVIELKCGHSPRCNYITGQRVDVDGGIEFI